MVYGGEDNAEGAMMVWLCREVKRVGMFSARFKLQCGCSQAGFLSGICFHLQHLGGVHVHNDTHGFS